MTGHVNPEPEKSPGSVGLPAGSPAGVVGAVPEGMLPRQGWDGDPRISPEQAPALWEAVARARTLGVFGDRPLADQIRHAWSFGDIVEELGGSAATSPVLDLGSGGGLPGLVLAHRWPGRPMVLLDSAHRRCALLEQAIEACCLGAAVAVVCARAEVAGRDPQLRGEFGVVVARSFGPPPVTAECAAPFLQVGGVLVVSEPPDEDPGRWPVDALGELGLRPVRTVQSPVHLTVLQQDRLCPERYPRRVGIATKRPLYRVVPVAHGG